MIINPDEIGNSPHHLCFGRFPLSDFLLFIILVINNIASILRISGRIRRIISRFLNNRSVQYEGIIFYLFVTVLVVRHHLIRSERVGDQS